jgi:riboflavin transporter FmnP
MSLLYLTVSDYLTAGKEPVNRMLRRQQYEEKIKPLRCIMNTQRLGPIILLIISITAIHIYVPMEKLPSHNYIRELYLIPIILAGLWWGTKGGLAVAIISSLVYLPHFLFKAPPDFHTRNIVEILLFNLVGYLVGRYRDTTKRDCIAA